MPEISIFFGIKVSMYYNDHMPPHYEDRTASVYFSDGKIVRYDMNPFLDEGVFQKIRDRQIFIGTCTIMNDTLAWDINNGDTFSCIDIDPEMLYELDAVTE